VLIAILTILVVGFAVNGWQSDDNLPDSGDVGNKTDDTDEKDNLDGTNSENDTQNNAYHGSHKSYHYRVSKSLKIKLPSVFNKESLIEPVPQ
jgi:hypothetical protein